MDAGDVGLSKHLSFDSVKGSSFLKFTDGQLQRFRMFPYIEKKGRADEYGSSAGAGVEVGDD